jgi:hypothetical protein
MHTAFAKLGGDVFEHAIGERAIEIALPVHQP